MKFLFLILFSFSALAQTPTETTIEIKGKLLSVYANHQIGFHNSKITKAVITIHGSTRNADTYFKTFYSLAKRNETLDSTLIISPHFKAKGDEVKLNELVYSYLGWWIGDPSLYAGISSFDVVDELILKLIDKRIYPNLKELFITGHSAGGHLTQRLALGSRLPENFNTDIIFIVANPGTYAYLTNKRPIGVNTGIYQTPLSPSCDYDDYKYGMNNRNPYMSRDSVNNMIERFTQRQVIYFVGENDTGDVEHNCAADFQGPHRYGRGLNFMGHVNETSPDNSHRLITAPGVGHTQWGMYNSNAGKEIFNF